MQWLAICAGTSQFNFCSSIVSAGELRTEDMLGSEVQVLSLENVM